MFYQKTLHNGLTLIGESREGALSTALGFFVKTGARDETPEIAGVSHFLEHMMFKGTKKRSALELTYDLGAIGAQANAFTSEENTVYYMTILPEYFEKGMDIICDIMRSTFVQEEFDMEKKVILEEIALYQDKPHFVLYENAVRKFFADHPGGNSVLGTNKSISEVTREQMLKYFTERYSPSNMVFAVSGAFDWEQFSALAENYCGAWENYPASRDTRAHIPVKSSGSITKKDLQLPYVCFMASGPSMQNDLRYSMHLLVMILGDATGSKVYWELVDKGLADGVTMSMSEMDGTGFILAYAGTEDKNLDKVSDILRNIMLSAKDFTDEDLERAKTKYKTRLVLHGENSMSRLVTVGMEWVYNKKYQTIEEELEIINRITKRDILDSLKEFSLEPMTEMRLIACPI